ncbi:MAG: nucleotide exchange factor GrpE [Cytophagales bacterium]|nr:nucleotide exchange factor GrpE [Armatimonadota bacterium]
MPPPAKETRYFSDNSSTDRAVLSAALPMDLADIQREIAALPATLPPPDGITAAEDTAASAQGVSGPLQIVSKQGRVILRLSAAVEALESQTKALADEAKRQRQEADAAGERLRQSERRARQTALEAIHLMDALDWVGEAVGARGDLALSREIVSAQRDCLRRLAAVGVTEIPAARGAAMDGRLHEGLEAAEEDGDDGKGGVPQYHIRSLVRRGYQIGPDILRRAGVITAA